MTSVVNVAGRSFVGGAAGTIGVGMVASAGTKAGFSIHDLMASFLQGSRTAISAESALAPQLALQTASLNAGLQTLGLTVDRLARAQSGPRLVTVVGLAAPLVAGAVIWYRGWATLGWVSLRQLQVGLSEVKAFVGTRVEELKTQMLGRFDRTDEQLAENKRGIQQVGDSVASLRADVQGVNERMSSVDLRLSGLEQNMRRSKDGIEVVCELLYTSGLLNGASDSALRKLRIFTDGSSDLMDAGLSTIIHQPHQPPRAGVLRELEGPPSSAAFITATPTFMHKMLMPAPDNQGL